MKQPPLTTRPNFPTKNQFLEWLETRNPHEEFDFMDNQDCLFSKCLNDHGWEDKHPVMGIDYVYISSKSYNCPKWMVKISQKLASMLKEGHHERFKMMEVQQMLNAVPKKLKFPPKTEFFKWLKKRDDAETFNFLHPRDCLFARFLKDQGWKNFSMGVYTFSSGHFGMNDFLTPKWVIDISHKISWCSSIAEVRKALFKKKS